MTKKVYKTATGKILDIGALMLQNETVRAVGNMGVNAKGDIIDSSNKVIEQSNKRIGKQYAKQVGATDDEVTSSLPRKNKHEETKVVEQTTTAQNLPKSGSTIEPQDTNGLAAAIAKAKLAAKDKNKLDSNKDKGTK